MSRLDSFIRRMQAQRACIDHVAMHLEGLDGPVVELGLGNGRTYDHLRERFPAHPIYVFDRHIAAHPDCVPQPELTRLGDFRETLPAFAREVGATAAFIHADIGNGSEAESQSLAAILSPTMHALLAPGGYVASDQVLAMAGLVRVPLPDSEYAGRCHLYRKTG